MSRSILNANSAKADIVAAWAQWCAGAGLLDQYQRPPVEGAAFWMALRKMPEMSGLLTTPAKTVMRGGERVQAVQIVIQGPACVQTEADPFAPITP